jgi:hypothetical protein
MPCLGFVHMAVVKLPSGAWPVRLVGDGQGARTRQAARCAAIVAPLACGHVGKEKGPVGPLRCAGAPQQVKGFL